MHFNIKLVKLFIYCTLQYIWYSVDIFILLCRSLSSTENIGVSLLTCGEGWHNYHHAFPWDYKMAEIGNYKFNLAKTFIDFFAYIGLAYDLKTVSVDVIKKRVLRCGESTENPTIT